MTTLVKIIIASILSLLLVSCNFNVNSFGGVKGNGNVITTERPITESFSSIKVTEGLLAAITQSNTESVSVEADENLQELIITEIENGVLKIYTKKQIDKATSKKIRISFKAISSLITSSGSSLSATNTINASLLDLKTSSGSNLNIDVNADEITCNTTSGSATRLSGKSKTLLVEASSGSTMESADLMTFSCEAKATSGSSITVNTSEALIAKASSAATISYYGNPKQMEKNVSSAGSIHQK